MKKLLSLSIIGILSGCVSTQSANFRDTSSAYREVVEQYANDNILLNIVRASKDMPMSFLDIPSVVGSGSYTGTAGINASTTLANAQSPIQPAAGILPSNSTIYGSSLGMAVNNSFTFTQSSLDNAHFMSKFLEDVPPETIRFYGSQKNLPRPAMLLLLIDNIEIRTIDNEEVAWWTNDPRSKDYKEFQFLLDVLLDAGLTVEAHPNKQPLGPPISEKEFVANYQKYVELIKDTANQSGISLEKITIDGKAHHQLYKINTATRFCINKYKSENLFGKKLGKSSYCTDSPIPQEKLGKKEYSGFLSEILNERNPRNKELELRIKLRSTGNIFDYLGNALIAQYQDPSRLVMVTSKDVSTYKPNYGDPAISVPLFKVYKNGNLDDAISKVTYRSDVYYIKDDDGSYTKSVFEFLATMLTLSKRINSIPPSPTILVR
ncbi:hypothetical protein [Polynucleobacter sp. MWH-UH23A]|uniref:hypothetical protein n=1 Tax=Polynucleobacter sp. MWH-UH23A TaxID=1855613 RepID=UPI003364D4B6